MADPSENQDIKAAGNNSEEKHVHWNLMEQHYTGTKHVPKRRTRVNSKVNYGNDDDEYVWCGIPFILILTILILCYLLYILFHESKR